MSTDFWWFSHQCGRRAGSRDDGSVRCAQWKWTSQGCRDHHWGFHRTQPPWGSQQSLLLLAWANLCLGPEVPQHSKVHFWSFSKDACLSRCWKTVNKGAKTEKHCADIVAIPFQSVLLTVWDQSVSSLWHFHFAFMYFLFFSFLINPVRHKASFFYLEFWSSSTLPSTVQLAVNMLNKSVGNVKNLEKCFKIKLSCFVSSCQF